MIDRKKLQKYKRSIASLIGGITYNRPRGEVELSESMFYRMINGTSPMPQEVEEQLNKKLEEAK